jgi:hypothetical protein
LTSYKIESFYAFPFYLQIIKSNLQPQNNTKPIYYYIGTRLGQILHTRLRMQCSSLNHHLFRKNIVNSPFRQCGAPETTAHFLLHCPRHNATRLKYIHTINLPTIVLPVCLQLTDSDYIFGIFRPFFYTFLCMVGSSLFVSLSN